MSLETQKGFFCEKNAGLISHPVKNATICLQTRTRNGRNAGQLYIYDSNGNWVEYTDAVFFSPGSGGFVNAPNGDHIVDPSGNRISLTQGVGTNRVFMDSSTISFDFSPAGQVRAMVI